MGLEVALEVEDLELVILVEAEKGAELVIGVDDLLGHELVVLGVAADARSHLRAAEQSTRGNTQEGAKSIRDLSGLGEDGGLLGLLLTALSGGGLAAATLGGLLELTRDLLLELLRNGEDAAQGRAKSVELLDKAVVLGNDVDIGGGGSGGGLSGRSNGRRGSRNGGRNGLGGRGGLNDGLGGSDGRSSRNRRSGSRGLATLGGGLGGRGGGDRGGHSYVDGRDTFPPKQTRSLSILIAGV